MVLHLSEQQSVGVNVSLNGKWDHCIGIWAESVFHFQKYYLEIMKEYEKVRGNIHFYAGTWEQAKRFFDIGFTISFTGVITFAKDYEEVVRNAPLNMIHAETDCPYVAPTPHRGKRNEPLYVKEVYKKIAEIRGETEEVVRVQLMENAKKLYELGE